ncbi:MAG: hypothetical protein IKU13_06935 [Clostridia bacterium]|nr:hypothetical protein [Clostridia bacterium]
MKKYRAFVIFALILLLLVLFRGPIENIFRYKSGTIRDLFSNVESMYEKVECVTREGEYELDQVERQQFVRNFLNTKVKTNVWNKEFVFPDTEYRIYFSHPGDGIAFRVKMTDEAIEIWEREFYTSDKHHVFLIDN